jgi:hypothetical protein
MRAAHSPCPHAPFISPTPCRTAMMRLLARIHGGGGCRKTATPSHTCGYSLDTVYDSLAATIPLQTGSVPKLDITHISQGVPGTGAGKAPGSATTSEQYWEVPARAVAAAVLTTGQEHPLSIRRPSSSLLPAAAGLSSAVIPAVGVRSPCMQPYISSLVTGPAAEGGEGRHPGPRAQGPHSTSVDAGSLLLPAAPSPTGKLNTTTESSKVEVDDNTATVEGTEQRDHKASRSHVATVVLEPDVQRRGRPQKVHNGSQDLLNSLNVTGGSLRGFRRKSKPETVLAQPSLRASQSLSPSHAVLEHLWRCSTYRRDPTTAASTIVDVAPGPAAEGSEPHMASSARNAALTACTATQATGETDPKTRQRGKDNSNGEMNDKNAMACRYVAMYVHTNVFSGSHLTLAGIA